MLRRPEGATGWQQQTVRDCFTRLEKRQGIEVQVKSRERMGGPNKTDAKSSFTVYRTAP